SGGKTPPKMSRLRSSMRWRALILRTSTVARPQGVRPTRRPPCHAKCRLQRCRRGLNSTMTRPVNAVATTQIGGFSQIAFQTRPGQVGGIVTAVVLPGDDVLDVENQQRLIGFVQPAILTAVAGPQP